MSTWYVPSLYPILVLSASLAGLVLWRDRHHWPIAAYCGSLCAWAGAILLAAHPRTEAWGDRAMMVAFFVPATFLHVAARELGWPRALVQGTYAIGLAMTASSLAVPGLYVTGGGTEPGLLFGPMFVLTVIVGLAPLWLLLRRPVEPAHRERRRYLVLAGVAMALGASANVALMLLHAFYPLGLYLLTLSVGLMTYVAQAERLPSFSRFVENSQRYALLAAILSTVWMLVLVTVVRVGGGWTWEASLLLFVLTLTAQPLLTEARVRLTDRVFPGRGDAEGLTRALAHSEARAEHAARLAQIGTMASAVAHEVRNPLGVITACTSVLERQGASAEVLDEIRDQVGRAARFADDLLAYGRPSPVVLRRVSVADAARLAVSEVARAVPVDPPANLRVDIDGQADADGQELVADADLAQLVRLIAILVENAVLAGASEVRVAARADGARVVVDVTDDGPGVPAAIAPRLFEPFVSGRGRAGPRPGTGLGLAIAHGIAARHRGALAYRGACDRGGAWFELALPRDAVAGAVAGAEAGA